MTARAEDGPFWELIARERHTLWRLSRSLTCSYEDARDLMSDTVLAAYTSFPSLRDHGAFRWFLSTIAVRIQRRKRWRSRIFVPIEEAESVGYEMTAESSHDLELVVRSLDRLPNREREALVLFEIGGLSLKEIQAIQGGSISGVKSRMSRGRERLAAMITDDAPLRTHPSALAMLQKLPATLRLQEL